MGKYRPAKYSQMDGSAFDDVNCVWACITELVDQATCGALRIAAPVWRKLSGDTSGGSTYNQGADTVLAYTTKLGRPVRLKPRYDLDRAQLKVIGRSGSSFVLSIWTGVTLPTRFRTNNLVGGHSVFHHHYFVSTDVSTIDDPGTTAAGYMLWPFDLAARAAEARTGGDHNISILMGPDTEDVERIGAMKAVIRAKPRHDSPRAGVIVPGRRYGTLRTINGGPWEREDGGLGTGWYQLDDGTWVPGKGLKEAA